MSVLKSNKEIRNYAHHNIKFFGGVENFKKEISKAIQDLSTDDAMSNCNQIYYFTRVLFYLRYEYQKSI